LVIRRILTHLRGHTVVLGDLRFRKAAGFEDRPCDDARVGVLQQRLNDRSDNAQTFWRHRGSGE
jgi:hypothetical protein